jgi:hypothetical protein
VIRFGLSLLAAGLITFAGYAALGHAATSPSGAHMKVIATVTARAHHRPALSDAAAPQSLPLL